MMGLATATTARAELDEILTAQVLAVNQADVPDIILKQAELEATRIFAAIGITLLWTNTTPGSAEPYPASAAQLKITIIPESRMKQHRRNLGAAQRFDVRAYAFYNRIEGLSHHNGIDVASLLGHVIAHEIGHLLLPYDSHTSSGLMRGEWNRGQLKDTAKGVLAFTAEQAELIRTYVRATFRN
jgi:hypothetical protein